MKIEINYLQRNSAEKRNKSIVLIEPHGDLALEVLSFWLNTQMDRVVYVDPYIRDTSKQAVGKFLFEEEYTPVINPFQIKDKSARSIDFVSQELTGAFVEILKDKNFSIQMDALLKPCIATLLRKGDATLRDLQRFMNDNENADLIQLWLQSPKETDRAFFQYGFHKGSISLTKNSIYFKMQSLLNSYTFSNLVLGKSTIDLEDAINSWKVVIFNLAKWRMGKKVSPVFGKLIIALIQWIVLKRQDTPEKYRKKTFLFVDEFQNYVTDSVEDILAESRKYALHLTLSHQLIGQKMDAKMKDIILGNTALKIVWESGHKTMNTMAKEIGLSSSDFQEMPEFHFYLHNKFRKHKKVLLLKSPSFMLGRKGFFYLSNRSLKKLFKYLVEESGQYVKVKKQIAPMAQNQVTSTPNLIPSESEKTIIIPKFSH